MPVTDIHNPPTLTATTCLNATCQQWYWLDCRYDQFKIPIPNATGLQHIVQDPATLTVTWESLGPEGPSQQKGCFLIEVFDESHIPHASAAVTIRGAWE
jgi:hypothetical protein